MKTLYCSLLAISVVFLTQGYYGSTTAPVIVAGGIIKAKHLEPVQKKYKRSQCPVCKGKGWYISGDKIQKVECGYCEPDKDDGSKPAEAPSRPHTIIHRK